MPLLDRILLGKSGEDLACRELRRRGYEILARRYRTRVGELDIVARDGPTIVFVEVKTRTTPAYGAPGEAVGPRKQHKIWLMASDYLLRRSWYDRPCRFDVVAISIDRDGRRRIEVITGAFDGR
jgi:putative endonuclease